jgi:hypothetical protein
LSGDIFDSDGTGDGVAGTFSGSFTDDTSTVLITNAGTTTIYGSNTFYNFTCTTAGAEILFQKTSLQTFDNNLILSGTDGNEIDLGNDDGFDPTMTGVPASPYPAAGPAQPEQWLILINNIATIDDVRIQYSYANSPITPDPSCDDFGGNNSDWLFFIPIEYSWSEDTDGDGRIDRIRVRVDTGVQLSDPTANNFSGVDAEVEGFSLDSATPFSTGTEVYEFFINLAENKELDTDVTPQWRLTHNDPNAAFGLIGVVGGSMVEFGDTAPYNTPEDRAAPAVGYTLAVKGKDEIFVHLSEFAEKDTGGAIDASDFDYNGTANILAGAAGLTRITNNGDGTKEFVLHLDGPVTADEMYEGASGNGYIILNTDLDDQHDVVWPADGGAVPAGGADTTLTLTNPNPLTRVSDLGLGLTGSGLIQPTYALNLNTEITRDPERGGIGYIERVEYGNFDTSGWLQDQDFTLEVSIDTNLSIANTEDIDLIWDTSVTTPYLLNNLWLPPYNPPDYPHNARDYLCDLIFHQNTSAIVETDPTPPFSDSLRTYNIDASNPKIRDNTEFQFFLRDENGFLYARVDDSNATDWYRTIRPWAFKIRNVRQQTSRVSILDNVIDPRKGDKVELHYILDKAGLITIQIFNLAGDLIDTVYRGRRPVGEYTTAWDGRNQAGHIVARGIYFVRVTGPDLDEYLKVMVVK